MAIGFIWKKQLVLFATMFLVVLLGLTVGAFLHDRFTVPDQTASAEETQRAMTKKQVQQATQAQLNSQNASIQMPSLSFPTSKPNVTPPPKH